ncbi:MAG: spore coat protein [Bacillota bacterium]|nr:spore coat protein [Bacillota bacterium]
MDLTQKEKTLLQDLKAEEELCIEKYTKYSGNASDQNLKTLFGDIKQVEQKHLDSVNQMLNGTAPQSGGGTSSSGGSSGSTSGSSSGGSNTTTGNSSSSGSTSSTSGSSDSSSQSNSSASNCSAEDKQKDKYLCQDALTTEKHVSSSYNTSIFEFKDTGFRDALNHIQKEEQQHGEQIYNYMSQNGMYS